ncbi:hypothetical protein SDC9_146157 [bioreactor metagenome]|uniref:Uncharacterized protein n=1 Tax=bioreactor metagenome TaxID=1076179 RepID=A0A645EAJ2_9ZZZZ
MLLHPVKMIQPRLRRPADIQRRENIVIRPVHEAYQLVPILHIGKVKVFHGRAGDHQPVEMLFLHLVKGTVKRIQIVLRGILALIAAGAQQRHLHLQRRVGEQPQELHLRGLFGRHKV